MRALLPEGSIVPGLVLFLVLCAAVLGLILFVISRIAKATGGARATPATPASSGLLGSGSSRRDDDKTSSSSSGSSSGSDFGGRGGGSSGGGGASSSW